MSLREKIITCIRIWQGEMYSERDAFDLADAILVSIASEQQQPCGNCGKPCLERYCDICHAARMKALDELAAESQRLGL
jgi:hypothetical protein